MIAKRITSKAAKPRMARLVKYVVAAEGGLDPRSWARTADYMLCSKTNNRGEKVGGVRVTNCHTDDPAAATSLIEATQAANTRSKADKTYHLVFSFPPGEEPPIEILHKIEDELVASIGYADHQRISAVHIDCDHLHVHVAINKVHPKGYQNIEPYFDKKKLMEACDRLELEYGLTRTNHGLTGERKREKQNAQDISGSGTHDDVCPNRNRKILNGASDRPINDETKPKGKAADAEAHSGIESLQGHVSREVAPKLKEAKTWKEAHSILAKHGLQIKKRGAGLVIGNGEIWVKASQCDRALSLKALSDRLGPMEQGQKPVKAYEPKPKQSHPSSAALYEKYQQERNAQHRQRERGLEQIQYESDLLEHKLKQWRVAQRLIVKAGFKGPKRRAALKLINFQTQALRNRNRKAIAVKRKEFIAGSSFSSWARWLAQNAVNGNSDAHAVLRSMQEREQRNGDCLSAPDPGSHFVVPGMKPEMNLHGAVTYKTHDGGVVIDRAHHVQCFRTTAGSAQMALELAAKRFKGQALIVEGSERFRNDVARFAGAYGIDVRFSDPEMEMARKAAITPISQKRQSIHRGAQL